MALWVRSLEIQCHMEQGVFSNLMIVLAGNWAEQIGWPRICVYCCIRGSSVVQNCYLKRSLWKTEACFWRDPLTAFITQANMEASCTIPWRLWQWLHELLPSESCYVGGKYTMRMQHHLLYRNLLEVLLNVFKLLFLCRMNCTQWCWYLLPAVVAENNVYLIKTASSCFTFDIGVLRNATATVGWLSLVHTWVKS